MTRLIMAALMTIGVLLFAESVAAFQDSEKPQFIPKSPEVAVILGADGTRHEFRVELALTSRQQARGLMFRESLADDEGMLFPFARPRQASFWMRNTIIPLDLIFVRRNGKIANIIENAEPLTETQRRSKGQVMAVLELRGGLTAELGIKAGDTVYHSVMGLPAPK